MKKILVVDDTKTWLHFHTELINSFYADKFEIYTCSSAREALKVLHEHLNPVFDIIITDMQMEQSYLPLLAGEWLVQNLRMIKEYKNVPVITISAMNDLIERAKRLKIDCISKARLVNNKLLFKYMIEKSVVFS